MWVLSFVFHQVSYFCYASIEYLTTIVELCRRTDIVYSCTTLAARRVARVDLCVPVPLSCPKVSGTESSWYIGRSHRPLQSVLDWFGGCVSHMDQSMPDAYPPEAVTASHPSVPCSLSWAPSAPDILGSTVWVSNFWDSLSLTISSVV